MQGIAFNLIIIRIDQGKALETTLISERSGTSSEIHKRSLRFRISSKRTGTGSAETEEGESDNVGRNHSLAMVSFSTSEVDGVTGTSVKALPMAA